MIEPLLQAERLLLHGLLDQAEVIYRRTLDSDPRNAIAAVGLAKVALERDDLQGAYQHACHALEIDRQNPSALRLEARLSEVLFTRGEPVERPSWLASHPAPAPTPDVSEDPADTGATEHKAAEGSAEQAVFARNRSMADHRRMDDARRVPVADQPPPETTPVVEAAPAEADPARPERSGLLRRLLGR
jgi:hypothetical protein